MKLLLSLISLTAILAGPCFASRTLTDEMGRKVVVPDHPHRVICLMPTVTDTAFALGAGDDVVVVANFSNVPLPSLNIGFPRGGQWHVRFNSGAAVYDRDFTNGDSFDTVAGAGARDGLNFNGNVGIGRYSVVILSQ